MPPDSRLPFLLCRVGAILAFAVIGISFPELGPNRFLFASYCALVVAPLSAAVEFYFPVQRYAWSQPIFDTIGCAIAVQLLPEAWTSIFMVGLVAANTRLIVPAEIRFRYIAVSHVIVIVGQMVSAMTNDIEGWLIPMLTVISVMPAVLYYSQREAERILKQREHVARLNSIAFVSRGVAHDFNNALTGVRVNASLAHKEVAENEPAAELIQAVLDACNYATRLTQQMMELSGKPKSDVSSCDVAFEVKSLVGLLQNVAPPDVDIVLEVGDEIPVLHVDRTKLQQVVMNLLLNAVEAVEPPSKIRLRLSHTVEHVVIDIIDSGPGIPKSDLARIFEPFFSSKSTGSGIGLSTARHIVESAGGVILVDTTVGQGTHMSARFPIDTDHGDTAKGTSSSSVAVDNADGLTRPSQPFPARDDSAESLR